MSLYVQRYRASLSAGGVITRITRDGAYFAAENCCQPVCASERYGNGSCWRSGAGNCVSCSSRHVMCPYKTWGTLAQVEARREDDRARREWAALEFAEREEIVGLVNEMLGRKGSQVEVVDMPDSVRGMLKKLEGEKEARRVGGGKSAKEGPREESRRTRSSARTKVVINPEASISAPTPSRPTKKRKITSRAVIDSQDDDDSDDVVVVVPRSLRNAEAGPSRAARGRRPISPPAPLFLEVPSRTTPLDDREIVEDWRQEFEALMRKERLVEAQEEWARLVSSPDVSRVFGSADVGRTGS